MLKSESGELNSVFDKTNPHLTYKRRYKRILTDSNCHKVIMKTQNIFDPADEEYRMGIASHFQNP
jgi:hypothetical protein